MTLLYVAALILPTMYIIPLGRVKSCHATEVKGGPLYAFGVLALGKVQPCTACCIHKVLIYGHTNKA